MDSEIQEVLLDLKIYFKVNSKIAFHIVKFRFFQIWKYATKCTIKNAFKKNCILEHYANYFHV